MVKGETYDLQLFESEAFRHFINVFTNKQSGVTLGCTVTKNSQNITVGEGYFFILGGLLRETTGTTNEIPTDAGYYKLVYEIDLSKTNTKDVFNQGSYKFIKSLGDYPTLTQEDLDNGGNIYQFEFCQFRITDGGLQDFKDTRKFVDYGIYLKKDENAQMVLTYNERLPIPAMTRKKIEFTSSNLNGENSKLTFDEESNSVIIGKNVKKINVKAQAYATLLKVACYCELRILKNTDTNICANGISYGASNAEISMVHAEGYNIEVEEGDKIYLTAYNSNTSAAIALDTFVKTNLIVEVVENE